jgi:hypothetical protein
MTNLGTTGKFVTTILPKRKPILTYFIFCLQIVFMRFFMILRTAMRALSFFDFIISAKTSAKSARLAETHANSEYFPK